jgi:zinc protease
MSSGKVYKICLIVLIGFNLFIGKAYSQALPVDESMLIGNLENGLKYYIKSNNNPESQLELRLVINTGSLYEEESEQGFAHFVEHMCFNGTENFPGNEVISYLESKGMRFGRHFNALTSFAETKYMLSLPNPDEELVNNGFQILEDWAHNVSFEDEEIEKERGVIIQEYRTGLGPETRLRDQYFPAIFQGALYQYRLPIGKKEILESFKPDELRQFYYKWYRPERMAVIVVGNIDKNKALTLVESHFGEIKNEYPKGKIPSFEVKNNESPVFKLCSDQEASKELIRIYYLNDPESLKSYDDLRTDIIQDLIIGMITKRFQEIGQSVESPFIYSQPGIGYMVRTKDAFTLTAVAKPGNVEKAFQTLLTEDRRLMLHGLTEDELDLEKKIQGRKIETMASEKVDSKKLADELMDKFLKNDPAVSTDYILEKASSIIKDISLKEVNENLRSWLGKSPIIIANVIDENAVPEFQNGGLEKIYTELQSTTPKVYVSSNSENVLLAEIENPGTVTKEERLDEFGIVKWTLSNGARVILKPTDFDNDKVLFESISKGGTSQYGDEDYVSADLASKVAYMSGLGGVSFSNLRSDMQMKGVRVGTWMSSYGEGTSGYCTVDGIEDLLSFNNLYFSMLKADSSSAEAYISRIKSQIESFENEPDHVFSDTIFKSLYGADSRRFVLADTKNFEQFKLERANQIVKERFSDPSGFTFIFVGSFDIEKIKPLVEKYIGGMKGDVKNEVIPREDYFAIRKSKDITVYSGKADKSMVDINYFGEMPWTIENRATASVMTEVLKINLRKALREDKSGVYGISVSTDAGIIPDNYYKFEIFFQCATDLVDTLINEAFRQIEIIKKEGPDKETLAKVKTVLKSEYDQKVLKNDYWQEMLVDIYGFDKDIHAELADYMPAIIDVSAKDVQKLAQKKLRSKKMLIAKMYPESFKKN